MLTFKLIGTFYLRCRIALRVLASNVRMILLRLLIAGILIMELWCRDSSRIGLRPGRGRSLWNSYQLLSAIRMLHQPVSLLRRGYHLLVLNGLLLHDILLSLMLLVLLMCLIRRLLHSLLHLVHS